MKPNNLLIDAAGHTKISDFGLAKVLDVLKAGDDTYVMTGETGSYRYMAPEVFRHEKYTEKVCRVGVWGVGVGAFSVFASHPPFPPLVG